MKDSVFFIRIGRRLQLGMANKIVWNIRTLILSVFLFVSIGVGYAQEIDNFIVGPYEVDYKGEGDFHARLRPGVDLYSFFKLKKDTIINIVPEQLEHGLQVCVDMDILGTIANSNFNTWGISAGWKQQIGGNIYINGGVSLNYSMGKYISDNRSNSYIREDRMLEFGIPVSLELAHPYSDYNRVSLYGGLGFIPALYSTISVDEISSESLKNRNGKDVGIFVSPRLDFGGYIPVAGQLLRVGIYGEYRICCFQNISIYKKRVSRTIFGVTVGCLF